MPSRPDRGFSSQHDISYGGVKLPSVSAAVGRFELRRRADLPQVGRVFPARQVATRRTRVQLGVRYVLEGSVQRLGNQVRVNAQLIDAETDAHLWAERFDGDSADLFTLQNEITSRIAGALNLELTAREAARPTMHPDVAGLHSPGTCRIFETCFARHLANKLCASVDRASSSNARS